VSIQLRSPRAHQPGRRRSAWAIAGFSVLLMSACGSDSDSEDVPVDPGGSVFGTTAQVDNSTGNYTPVDPAEAPEP
jgi:hypothetical protein